MDGGKGKPISFRIMTACLEEGTDRPLHLFHGNKEVEIQGQSGLCQFLYYSSDLKKNLE